MFKCMHFMVPQKGKLIINETPKNSKITRRPTIESISSIASSSDDSNIDTDPGSKPKIETQQTQKDISIPQETTKTSGVKFDPSINIINPDNSGDEEVYGIEYDNEEQPDIQEPRRKGFHEPLEYSPSQEIETHPKTEEDTLVIKNAIGACEFLNNVLTEDNLNTIIDAMFLREVDEGTIIIEEGEPGNHLYIAASGTFEVYVSNKLVNTFSDCRVFGELAILYNAKRMATIKTKSSSRIWVLQRHIYQQILVQNAIKDREEVLSFLMNVPLINKLKEEKLQRIADLLKKEFFKTGMPIVQQGDRGDKFYIIRAGSVTVTKDAEGKVNELYRGAYFGERALTQDDCRQATVTANSPGVECLTLTQSEFKEHFDVNIFDSEQVPIKEETVVETEPSVSAEYSDIKLYDLERKGTLGVGGFGRVELVQHNVHKKYIFALKYLKKVDMVQQGQVEHVYNEKNIQMSCNTIFIVQMHKTFSDKKYIYFLMESCLGGDLWTFLQKQKGRHVGEQGARFFAACVLEALSYLHDRNYVYRDLKPENLLLDPSGYVKLTDFGFAKKLGDNGRTFTFAGTPEYVAPEIVYNRGHDKAVDYWAFGIFIYELLVGKTPFRSSDPTHMETYNRILYGINRVIFPSHVSKSATNIIQKLCKSIPTERLGCQKNGVQEIRNHKWFQGFEWNKLRNRKMKAPFIPKLTNDLDTRHFEKFKNDTDVPPDELSEFVGF